MDNTEWDIQLDAHPGPPCASRSSDGAYVPLGPAPSEYSIWCTVMMTTPTRIEGGARHRDGCRPLLAGPHSALAHKPLVPFRSAPATSVDGCASRQATDEGSEPEPRHAPAAVGLSTAGHRRACGPVGMARFMGAPRAECPAMDNPSGILPCARGAQCRSRERPPPEEIAVSVGSHLTAALIEG